MDIRSLFARSTSEHSGPRETRPREKDMYTHPISERRGAEARGCNGRERGSPVGLMRYSRARARRGTQELHVIGNWQFL